MPPDHPDPAPIDPAVTGAALAAELEVSTRTVYRDVADLMAQRVPIAGEAGLGYVAVKGSRRVSGATCDAPDR